MVGTKKHLLGGIVKVRPRKKAPGADPNLPSDQRPQHGEGHGRGFIAGRLRLQIISNRNEETLEPFVLANVRSGMEVRTDGWIGYDNLHKRGYRHVAVSVRADHAQTDQHLPMIHIVFGNLDAWLLGTHHGVSAKHLKVFLNAFVFRFNRRFWPMIAFDSALKIAARVDAPTNAWLYSGTWGHSLTLSPTGHGAKFGLRQWPMRLLGQTFGADIIEWRQSTLSAGLETTRSGLSRRLCEWLVWRSVNGKLREIDARKALLSLEREGLIELPPAQVKPPQCRGETQAAPPTDVQVAGKLAGPDEISLVAVSSKEPTLSSVWNAMLDAQHPLGRGTLCGVQQRYLIRSDRPGLARGAGLQRGGLAPARARLVDWLVGEEPASESAQGGGEQPLFAAAGRVRSRLSLSCPGIGGAASGGGLAAALW